jgi:hypothetical protein
VTALLVSVALAVCADIALAERFEAGAAGTGLEPAHPSTFGDQDTDDFLKAKGYVYTGDWQRAVQALKSYLETYRAARYGDEALYWLGRAIDRLSRDERTLERLIERKREAVSALDRLQQRYPASPWASEARGLRRSLLYQIALVGGARQRTFLEPFLRAEGKSLAEIRIQALDQLLSMGRGWAVPILRAFLDSEASSANRRVIVQFAGLNYPEEAFSLLEEVERQDANESVRAEARRVLHEIEMDRVPVAMTFFGFSARSSDQTVHGMLPEKTPRAFTFTPPSPPEAKEAQRRASRHFGGGLSDLEMAAAGLFDARLERLGRRLAPLREPLPPSPGRAVGGAIGAPGGSDVAVGEIGVSFPREGRQRTPDAIRGQAVFSTGGQKYAVDYAIDKTHEQLLAFRMGDRISFVLIQLIDRPGSIGVRETGPRADLRLTPSPSSPVASSLAAASKVSTVDVMGCKVESRRGAYSLSELRGQGVIDLGMATVQIRGGAGTWRLEGYVVADRTSRLFVGRNATLFDPSGRRVAAGSQITVPVDAPDTFKTGERRDDEPEAVPPFGRRPRLPAP